MPRLHRFSRSPLSFRPAFAESLEQRTLLSVADHADKWRRRIVAATPGHARPLRRRAGARLIPLTAAVTRVGYSLPPGLRNTPKLLEMDSPPSTWARTASVHRIQPLTRATSTR